MVDDNFHKSLLATCTAYVPMLAVETLEIDNVIDDVCLFAVGSAPTLKDETSPRKVFVWRISEGFREYGLFHRSSDEEGRKGAQITTGVTPESLPEDFIVTTTSNEVFSSEEEWDGANVPFALQFIEDYDVKKTGAGAMFILRDFHHYLGERTDLLDWMLRISEQNAYSAQKKTIVMTSPIKWEIPPEIENYVYKIKYLLPRKQDRVEKVTAFRDALTASKEQKRRYPKVGAISDMDIEDVSDAGAGLTRIQFENLLCMSLATEATMTADYILREKKKLIEQAGFKLITPIETFQDIGGLAPLKAWTSRHKLRFTDAAFEYGFPRYPRGMLLAGVPGCGKTLLAKAVAKEWGMNIIAVRAPDLKGSLVGESEAKVQKLLDTAEANGPIIVFVDEAEKLLGSQDSVRDGGAHDAVMAQFLSYMQDNTAGVYFVFTANDMNKFSPELVDRFEGRWFVDLPNPEEREAVIRIHLGKRKQEAKKLDMERLVSLTDKFSGRNIEDAIEEAMSLGFVDGSRPTTMKDYIKAFTETMPTSETKKAEIEAMREFVANGTMRLANSGSLAAGDEPAHVKNRGFA